MALLDRERLRREPCPLPHKVRLALLAHEHHQELHRVLAQVPRRVPGVDGFEETSTGLERLARAIVELDRKGPLQDLDIRGYRMLVAVARAPRRQLDEHRRHLGIRRRRVPYRLATDGDGALHDLRGTEAFGATGIGTREQHERDQILS
jgi:hypothetical protein